MPLRRAWICVGIALVLAWAGVAHATVVVPLTLADQVDRADLVVRARVRGQRSAWSPERGVILTWTELEVLEAVVGQAGPTLVLRQIGGVADGMAQAVPGDARLVQGDEVIVFLRRDASERDTVFLLALAQSLWHVERGLAQRDLRELGFAVLEDEGMRVEEPAVEPPVAASALVARIRAIAGGAR